jgi:nitrogen regulatory protein PII
MKLVILITAQTENGLEVALAWREAGAPGVTIIPSHGLHSLQRKTKSGGLELPMIITSMADAMAGLLNASETSSLIILSVMPAEILGKVIEATRGVLGDLTAPDTGVVFVLDVEQAIGVRDHSKSE